MKRKTNKHRFTKLEYPKNFDLENFPSITCGCYHRKNGAKHTALRAIINFQGTSIVLFYGTLPNKEICEEIAAEINKTNDNTKIINSLFTIIRRISSKSWQDKFYTKFAKDNNISDYYRFGKLPRYVRMSCALKKLRQEINNLKRRVANGSN